MEKPKVEKRLTAFKIVSLWVEELASMCAGKTDPNDPNWTTQHIFMSNELSHTYPPSVFTLETAREISMEFKYGMPTVAQVRAAIEKWKQDKPEQRSGSKVMLSPERQNDPRVKDLDLTGRILLAQYDKRVREITEKGDPNWDSDDDDVKWTSKRANLADLYRTDSTMKVVWPIIAHPFGQPEAEEARFLRLRYANLDPDAKAKADALRRPEPKSHRPFAPRDEDEVNF
jgi:hypothetical protein